MSEDQLPYQPGPTPRTPPSSRIRAAVRLGVPAIVLVALGAATAMGITTVRQAWGLREARLDRLERTIERIVIHQDGSVEFRLTPEERQQLAAIDASKAPPVAPPPTIPVTPQKR